MDGQDFSGVNFLTVQEVASLIRVSNMTVYRMVHAGELPAVRFGRSYRVPQNAVESLLKGSFVNNEPQAERPSSAQTG